LSEEFPIARVVPAAHVLSVKSGRQEARSPLVTWTASLVALTLLVKIPGLSLFPALTLAIGLFLLPVIATALPRIRRLVFLVSASLIAIASGFLTLLSTTSDFGTRGSASTIATVVAWLMSVPIAVALGLWALSKLRLTTAVGLMATGGLIGTIATEIPLGWKGSLGVYATVLALTIVHRLPVSVARLVLAFSAALSAVSDARFLTLIALLAFVCTFRGSRMAERMRVHPVAWSLTLAGVVALVSQGAILAMKSGLLGGDVQARTIAQTANGRSLIESGRTEWAGSLHLFSVNPFGFGIGEITNSGVARDAIARVRIAGGDVTSDYFTVSVFGERVDLHSMTVDLWYHFGLGGLVFAFACLLLLGFSLPHAVRWGGAFGGAFVFMILVAAWDLVFSPMGNSDRLILGLVIAAYLATRSRDEQHSRGPYRVRSGRTTPTSVSRNSV
jgi:hypothetical protein